MPADLATRMTLDPSGTHATRVSHTDTTRAEAARAKALELKPHATTDSLERPGRNLSPQESSRVN